MNARLRRGAAPHVNRLLTTEARLERVVRVVVKDVEEALAVRAAGGVDAGRRAGRGGFDIL